MIRKIRDLFLTVKDKTVSLSKSVCRNVKQLAVFSAKKITESTGKFASLIGKYAFVLSVFSVIGVVMFFVRRVLAKQG